MNTARSSVLAAVFALVGADVASARTINGSNGGQTHTGSRFVDTIHGLGGGDRVYGRDGDDALFGDTGPDRVLGENGDDTLDGGSGGDTVRGGLGNDKAIGGFGLDELHGGPGNDDLDGGAAADVLFGDEGDDVLAGSSAGDVLWGGPGNDRLSGGSGYDQLRGGDGDDLLYANEGGIDRLADCGPGNDTLYIDPYGDKGGISDAQMVREGRTSGCETITELAADRDPLKGIVWKPGDYENADKVGLSRNDTLLGGHGSNRLHGMGGDDILWADYLPDLGGVRATRQRDYIGGGTGNDTIYGGRGSNVLAGEDGNDYLQGNGRFNTIRGGRGDDTIRVGSHVRSTVDAGPGDDLVTAIVGRGAVRVDCGPGSDTINVSAFKGNSSRVRHTGCEKVKRG